MSGDQVLTDAEITAMVERCWSTDSEEPERGECRIHESYWPCDRVRLANEVRRLKRIETAAEALVNLTPVDPYCECVFCHEMVGGCGRHAELRHADDCEWQALVHAVQGSLRDP